MSGRSNFSAEEADEIRRLLREKHFADPGEQKRIRGRIRAIEFYISDWSDDSSGFTAADFDSLLASGRVKVERPTSPLSSDIDLSILSDEGGLPKSTLEPPDS